VKAPDGHLVKASGGLTQTFSGIDNDGALTVQAGTFRYGAPSAGTTSDGSFVAQAGATLAVDHSLFMGASGRLGGPGTVSVGGAATLPAGAVLDPAVLLINGGTVNVGGTAPLTLPDVSLNGTFISSRPVTLPDVDVAFGILAGVAAFTVPSGGSFTKTTGQPLTLTDGADLVLNEDVTLPQGSICLQQTAAGNSDLEINETFTIAPGAPQDVFSCGTSSTALVHVNAPNGHLVKTSGGLHRSFSGIENDDTLTVQSGTFEFLAPDGSASSGGQFTAAAGATLSFLNSMDLGASGGIGGAGTTRMTAGVTLASGAALSPAILDLAGGTLTLDGSTALTLPDVRLTVGGNFDSDRPVTVNSLSAATGGLSGTAPFTVPAGGTFSKTTAGALTVRGTADVVLNENLRLDAGSICLEESGGGVGGDLRINKTFTIGSGAADPAFSCGTSSGLRIHVAAPDGRLVKEGGGTMTSFSAIDVQGRVDVAAGQTFHFHGAYSQSGGTTDVASGGVLQANPALSGGVLQGGGQVSGNLSNSGGTVRPGTSPGTLTVNGNYTQGAGGTLASEIASASSFDRLSVSGTATLDGTLAIASSHDPAASETFEILSAATRTGTFASVTGDQLPGKHYETNYGSDDVTLSVVVDAPENSAAPAASGSTVEGQTLTCNPGSWSGSPTFTFEWLRDGVPIAGATAQTYTLTGADVGKQIRCRVTATNSAGSEQATSSAVTPTAKPAAKPEPKPEPKPDPPAAPQPTTPASDPPAPCRDGTKPRTRLSKRGVKRRGKKLTVTGRSADAGACASGLRNVRISLAKVAGRSGVNCRFLRSPVRFSLTRAQNCRKPVLFTATGTDRWSFAFRMKLKPGKYRLQARAVDRAGNKETPKRGRSIVLFTVK
jgi:hypothetical protein